MEIATRVHRCLVESRLACGMFFASTSPAIMELVIHATEMDFAGVDLQHAPLSAKDSLHLLRTIQAADPQITPMVRLPNHDVYWIQQSLDAGYTGLIVPLVESAGEARALMRATYFPAIGARSMAGSIRAIMYGVDVDDMNRHTMLLPQIESAAGLEHVEEIVAVEGVSGVLMGPEDLSLSCGWRGKQVWSHPPFMEAVRRILAACREHGKTAAILTGAYQEAQQAGFDIIGFGGDLGTARSSVVESANEKLKQLRESDL